MKRKNTLPRAHRDTRPRIKSTHKVSTNLSEHMEPVVSLKLSPVTATMTVAQLAGAFADLDNKSQALFFSYVAKCFTRYSGPSWVAAKVGHELEQVSFDAVELLRMIVEAADEAMVKRIMES